MVRMGHSTIAAALLYQHATEKQGRRIAERLSEIATAGNVTPITEAKGAEKKPKKSRRRPA